MKNIKLILFITFGFLNCQTHEKMSNISLKNNEKSIKINKFKFETIGFSDKYDILPKLNFKEISEKEFNIVKNNENIFIQKTIKENSKKYFLGIKNNIIELNKIKSVNKVWYSYLGFYKNLNMYAFSSNSIDENLEFSDFEIFNSSNGKIYKITSPGDGIVNTPIPSIKNQYFAYFYNQIYEENDSFIGILKIDNGNLKEFQSFTSKKFKIYQLKWSNKDEILIKVSSDHGKSFRYYKNNLIN